MGIEKVVVIFRYGVVFRLRENDKIKRVRDGLNSMAEEKFDLSIEDQSDFGWWFQLSVPWSRKLSNKKP